MHFVLGFEIKCIEYKDGWVVIILKFYAYLNLAHTYIRVT